MERQEREETLRQMLSKQLADGGWSTPSFLADWKDFRRKDNKPHDVETPDAYGTGLALVVAREMGVPASDARLQKGVAWLKANQRESGKWFSRSPAKDSMHYSPTPVALSPCSACRPAELCRAGRLKRPKGESSEKVVEGLARGQGAGHA